MKDKVNVMMNKVYDAMGGRSQTTLLVIGMAIAGHINNRYWDEKDIQEYCELAVHAYWDDVDNREFLVLEEESLKSLVRYILQRCKEKAGIA